MVCTAYPPWYVGAHHVYVGAHHEADQARALTLPLPLPLTLTLTLTPTLTPNPDQEYPALYKPCKTAWCYRSSKFWSASIINSRQRRTFGDNGIIFTPSPQRNQLLCSFTSDSGTLNAGCQLNKEGHLAKGYEANRTEDMMRWSMKYSTEYNEVLINSTKYTENLPASVAAIVYGLRGEDSAIFDKVKAVKTYVSFLDEYNLNESQVPLLRASAAVFTDQESKELKEGETIFVDESAGQKP